MRIGHITDLHLRNALPGSASPDTTLRSRDVPELLARALDAMKRNHVEFVAVTGDVVDVPLYVVEPTFFNYYDFRVEDFLPEVEADYRRVRDILRDAGIPYMILPGNHDHEPTFWKVFEKDAHVDDRFKGFRFVRFADREWAFFVPQRVDRERLLMERTLAGSDARVQVHLQHFVIEPPIEHWYPHNYLEREHLSRTLSANGNVRLALSGHAHWEIDPVVVNGMSLIHAFKVADVALTILSFKIYPYFV